MLRSTSVDDHQVSESSETSHGEWKVCSISLDSLISLISMPLLSISWWNEPCYVLHHNYCSPRYIANLYLQLKHDNEEFRVMYREGPHGTPFHTLLVEGYVDGPLDVCKFCPCFNYF